MIKYSAALMVMMVGAAAWSSGANAEGRCPPGQYPVGGQGVGGCAPIPGAGSGNQQPATQMQTRQYERRFGAIAGSASTTAAGAAYAKKTRNSAVEQAMAECQRDGAPDCEVLMEYSNQCVSWVAAQPSGQGGVAAGETPSLALQNANAVCKPHPGSTCREVYAACSPAEPVD